MQLVPPIVGSRAVGGRCGLARVRRVGSAEPNACEALVLLFGIVIQKRSAQRAAKALLAEFGSLRAILSAAPEQLCAVAEVPPAAALAVHVAGTAVDVCLRERLQEAPLLTQPEPLWAFWRARLGHLRREVFEAVYLDSGFRLLPGGVDRLQEGTSDRVIVYPRRVLEAAIRREAAFIILAHNHTNGQCVPSDEDRLLTRALVLAAETVDLRIHDHLIVGGDQVFSFRGEGLL